MKYIRILIITTILSITGLVVFSSRVQAAPANVQPEDSDIYYTVSAGSTNGQGGNLLYSPEVWIRIYGGSNAGGSIQFIHGNHCNAGSGWDSNSYRPTIFELHGANPDGSIRLFDIRNSVSNTQQTNAGATGCGTVTLNIPAGALTQSSDPSHVTPFGTRLFTGIVKAYINPVNSTIDGPLNVFKVEGNGYWTGSIATAGWGISTTQTFLGRPGSSATDTYNLPFKPPCSRFTGSTTSINATLRWFDDDNGTSYQPPFTIQLLEFDEGPGLNLTNTRIIYERSGEGAPSQTDVTLRKGKKYIWQWVGITNRNGVQVYYPFESVDFYLTCPPTPSQYNLSASVGLSPDDENPGLVTFDSSATLDGPSFSSTITRRYYVLRANNTTQDIAVGNFEPPTPGPAVLSQTITASSNRTDRIVDPVPKLNLSAGDQLCVSISANPGQVTVSTTGVQTTVAPALRTLQPPACRRIVDKPSVSFYGGDVNAGGAFAGGNCALASGINTFTNGAFLGSGVNLAAQAFGAINGFASGRNTARAPKGLSFANSTAAVFGGNFGGSQCKPDYFSASNGLPVNSAPASIDVGALTNGSRRYNGSTTMSGLIPNDVRAAIYIDGNLRITNNIAYANPNWATTDNIPSLHVYVKGNITIDPGVQNITGFYVAQPSTPGTGQILTCAQPNGTRYSDAQLQSACNIQLNIRGSLVSQRTQFLRTFGSMRNATAATESRSNSSRSAEVIQLGPEMFLLGPKPELSTIPSNSGYEYYTSLPPIL